MDPMPAASLVLTHGRDKPFEIAGEVERQFVDAVRHGLDRVGAPYFNTIRAELAFYGDLWRIDAPRTGPESGIQTSDTEEIEKALAADMLEAVSGAETGPEAGFVINTLQGLLAKLEARLPIGKVALQWFLLDLSQYFTQPGLRQATIERVVRKIKAAPGKVVLLGHSMGSIVGYDLLTRHPDLPVDAFISFGSPLGFAETRRRVADENGQTLFPPTLRRWINVYNEDDFATSVRELAPFFPSEDNRAVEDVMAQGKEIGLAKMAEGHIAEGHNPSIYLSSVALAKKLRSILEDPA